MSAELFVLYTDNPSLIRWWVGNSQKTRLPECPLLAYSVEKLNVRNVFNDQPVLRFTNLLFSFTPFFANSPSVCVARLNIHGIDPSFVRAVVHPMVKGQQLRTYAT